MEGTDDLMTEELPENYQSLVGSEHELGLVRENAWKQALSFRLKSALNCIITIDGQNTSVGLEDLFALYDIGQGLLYKVTLQK